MQKRVSILNGRLEEEVDDFVATLLNEFGYVVEKITIHFVDDNIPDNLIHTFYVSHESSYLGKEVRDELFT